MGSNNKIQIKQMKLAVTSLLSYRFMMQIIDDALNPSAILIWV